MSESLMKPEFFPTDVAKTLKHQI